MKKLLGESIAMKSVEYINGIPQITLTKKEVSKMNILEDMQFVIIEKFSYGWPELEELRYQVLK